MTELSPLAWALTEKVSPFIARSVRVYCHTIEDETVMLNREVPRLAPLIVITPLPILANVWGVHPVEAEEWRQGIAAAVAEAAKPAATKQTIRDAFKEFVTWP